jgi:dihydroxyacetone kinase-like protein
LDSFDSSQGKKIILDLVQTIQNNAAYLSEIDGAIGDGDHGVNMKKGFTSASQQLATQEEIDLASGFDILGKTLFNKIGGAMGPLYGTFFMEMAGVCQGKADIDQQTFGEMLSAALAGVQALGNAEVGDKSLIDTLAPAETAYRNAVIAGDDFADSLGKMVTAAESGKESTRDLVAKVGRASRLGERSRGHLDAGATSCYFVLKSLTDSIVGLLDRQ